MLAIWSLVPLSFLNPAYTSGSSQFTYFWSLAWRILSITLLACEMSATMRQFEHSLALLLFGIRMKTDLFQSRGHCWVFQACWHIECSTLTAPSFRIWLSNMSSYCCSPWGRKESDMTEQLNWAEYRKKTADSSLSLNVSMTQRCITATAKKWLITIRYRELFR